MFDLLRKGQKQTLTRNIRSTDQLSIIKVTGRGEDQKRAEICDEMPKQEFTDWDLLAGPLCFVVFFIIVAIMLVCCFNWCFILKEDDLTKMEIWGYNRKLNWKLGPHSRKMIERKMGERLLAEEEDQK